MPNNHEAADDPRHIVARNHRRASEFMLHYLREDVPAMQRVLVEVTAAPLEMTFFVQSIASIGRAPLLRLLGQQGAEKLLEDAIAAMSVAEDDGPAE